MPWLQSRHFDLRESLQVALDDAGLHSATTTSSVLRPYSDLPLRSAHGGGHPRAVIAPPIMASCSRRARRRDVVFPDARSRAQPHATEDLSHVSADRAAVSGCCCAVLLHLNSFISPYHSPTADRTARATVRATTRHPHGSLSGDGVGLHLPTSVLSLSDLTLIWRLYYPDTSHLGQAPLSRQTETRYRTKHYTVTSSVSHEYTYPSKQHATVRFAFCRV